jgi:uncharacterized protein
MSYNFLELASTPSVQAAQAAAGSLDMWRQHMASDRACTRFGDAEIEFITARDSLYMATVSETGWPYIQHRGGPPGFVKVIDDRTLAFADFRGNRQYITLGNATANDRVALIMVDYPHRARLKLFAHLAVADLATDAALAARLALPDYKQGKPERAFVLTLETFDWNCPQHITPRFSAAEVNAVVAPLRARIAALEAETAALRARPR